MAHLRIHPTALYVPGWHSGKWVEKDPKRRQQGHDQGATINSRDGRTYYTVLASGEIRSNRAKNR